MRPTDDDLERTRTVERLAMRDACEIGGIHALRLMHDTTATAVEYGIYKSAKKVFDATAPQHIMFVDLGHASTSVSVVDFVIGKLVVRSTTFDRNLGGRDFDMAIAKWISTEFQAKHKDDPMSTPKTLRKLLIAAEKAKKTLSPAGVTEASLFIECLMNDIDFPITLSLEKYEELTKPLLDRLAAPIGAALRESGMAPADLTSCEIVGGTSRISAVKRTISGVLGLDEVRAAREIVMTASLITTPMGTATSQRAGLRVMCPGDPFGARARAMCVMYTRQGADGLALKLPQ